MATKNRYWVGICWLESMRADWQEQIGDIVELPFAYCVHDMDLDEAGEQRKPHVHLILAWANNTTYKYALSVFNKLSAENKRCCNSIEAVVCMRNKYEYLIHNTDAAKAAGKHQYLPEERITGNNFDIGLFEQISLEDKDAALWELVEIVKQEKIFNLLECIEIAQKSEKWNVYKEVFKSYCGLLNKVLDANYQRLVRAHFFDKPVSDPVADRREPAKPAGSDEQQSGSSKNGQ